MAVATGRLGLCCCLSFSILLTCACSARRGHSSDAARAVGYVHTAGGFAGDSDNEEEEGVIAGELLHRDDERRVA